jgi:hypothetical protein
MTLDAIFQRPVRQQAASEDPGSYTVGYLEMRKDRHGKQRYSAMYRDVRGEPRSAGTFSDKKQANKAWQNAEADVRRGVASAAAAVAVGDRGDGAGRERGREYRARPVAGWRTRDDRRPGHSDCQPRSRPLSG